MTSYILRIIAIISMLIDHAAYILIDPSSTTYIIMRCVGRLAFPIFCFLIVEGFLHTRSVRKYMQRLALFALLSEIPFDIAFHHEFLEFQRGQNVFITLLLGLIAITAVGRLAPYILKSFGAKKSIRDNIWMQSLTVSPIVFLCCWCAELLHTDYGYFGVLLIFLLYLLHDNLAIALIAMGFLNLVCKCFHYNVTTYDTAFYMTVTASLMRTPQLCAPLAAVPLGFYNGKPGSVKLRNLFYIFYPLHLLLLRLVYVLINFY